MHDLRIGDQALAPIHVRALSPEDWQAARDALGSAVEDHLYFQLGEQVYDAVFDARTKLNAALRAAIDAHNFVIRYNGQEARLLMVEDVESARLNPEGKSARPQLVHDWPPINP